MTIKTIFENMTANLSDNDILALMIDSKMCITKPEEWRALYAYSSRFFNDNNDNSEILSLIDNVTINDRDSLLELDGAICRQKHMLMKMYDKNDKEHKENPARILAQSCWLIHHGIKHILINDYGLISCEFDKSTSKTEYVFAP